MKQIGNIRILTDRVYPLDAETDNPFTTAVVSANSEHPLYEDSKTYFWVMKGYMNQRYGPEIRRVGDLFISNSYDEISDIEVIFPSKVYDKREWKNFTKSDICSEGNPAQRIKIILSNSIQRTGV